ncbi:hypothetical protein TCON_2039 [Astathelohania contejeani]|uniref:Uncharacterized protein n=1 Tax=Astathelohania contejeani TaxID=164912 RepID=A0ABQ7HX31_9MICR|nr:hypothetical protein TCON_2039 [Thelohania contejeani]
MDKCIDNIKSFLSKCSFLRDGLLSIIIWVGVKNEIWPVFKLFFFLLMSVGILNSLFESNFHLEPLKLKKLFKILLSISAVIISCLLLQKIYIILTNFPIIINTIKAAVKLKSNFITKTYALFSNVSGVFIGAIQAFILYTSYNNMPNFQWYPIKRRTYRVDPKEITSLCLETIDFTKVALSDLIFLIFSIFTVSPYGICAAILKLITNFTLRNSSKFDFYFFPYLLTGLLIVFRSINQFSELLNGVPTVTT